MKKRKVIRRLLAAVLTLTLAGSLLLAGRQLYGQYLADCAAEAALEAALAEPAGTEAPPPEAQQPPAEETASPEERVEVEDPPLPLKERPAPALPDEAQFLCELDLAALQESNEDVIGWIFLPDTVISYPLLRSRDNREYLTLTWDGKYSASGSIFLEQKNHADLSDFHTLIYGHNLGNGKMFSPLLDYGDESFAAAHPYVYVATEDTVYRYRVFSAYTADVVSDTYRLYFEDDARKASVLEFYLARSEWESPVTPTAEDRILTLSTCTGRGIAGIRWVVHTVLEAEYPR